MKQLVRFTLIFISLLGCRQTDEKKSSCDQDYLSRFDSLKTKITGSDREGYLQLVALFPLNPQTNNSFGSDLKNQHFLNGEYIPTTVGYTFYTPDSIYFEAAENALVKDAEGNQISHKRLALDQYGNSERLFCDSIVWMIKSFQDQRFIRVWNMTNRSDTLLHEFSWYDPNPEFILKAQYQSFEEARSLTVPTSMGVADQSTFVGAIHFNYNSQEYEVWIQDRGFLMFSDATSGTTTYGSGRYLDLEPPLIEGNLLLDFNYSYFPPCSFSDFTTCRFPPVQNQLPFKIEAGERYALANSY